MSQGIVTFDRPQTTVDVVRLAHSTRLTLVDSQESEHNGAEPRVLFAVDMHGTYWARVRGLDDLNGVCLTFSKFMS